MDTNTSRLLLPTQHDASSDNAVDDRQQHASSLVSAVNLMTEKPCGFVVDSTALDKQSFAAVASGMKLPLGWTQFADDHGVTYYVEPSTGTFQYTHPSLKAPPFAPDLTDYVMGHPAPDAPAWAWMLYLWVREVKSSHSVIGTLCAVSPFGCSLCAPPRDKLFQRRMVFRMYFMISSLISSTFLQVAFVMQFNPSRVSTANVSADQRISQCSKSTSCTAANIFIQFMMVSIPFGIFRVLIFRAFKTRAELERMRAHGLGFIAFRGFCGRFAVFLFALVTLIVFLSSVIIFFSSTRSISNKAPLVQTMMAGLAQGLLTELFFIPALLKKAYLLFTCRRERFMEETMAEIRVEVERMLSIRAIKLKLRSNFANMKQLPPALSSSAQPGSLMNVSSGQGPILDVQPQKFDEQPLQAPNSIVQSSDALGIVIHS